MEADRDVARAAVTTCRGGTIDAVGDAALDAANGTGYRVEVVVEGDVVSVTVRSEAGPLLAHPAEALDRYAERTVKRTTGWR